MKYTGAYKHDKNIFAYIADDTETKIRTCYAFSSANSVLGVYLLQRLVSLSFTGFNYDEYRAKSICSRSGNII